MTKRHRPYQPTERLPDWTPFEHATLPKESLLERQEHIEAIAKEFGSTVDAVQRTLTDIQGGDDVWINSRFQVNVRRYPAEVEGRPALIHLSIKRRDKQPVGVERYRDFQRIKDELLSPEHEAIEIYPARSREIDTSTQYHLWAFDDPTWRVPFGWNEGRKVIDPGPHTRSGAVQNPFEPHHPQ